MPPADASTRVIHGDCLDVLATMPAAHVDLVYLDPPFNTGRTPRALRGTNATYGDAWGGAGAYIDFMGPRLAACHRVLRPTGSILLHCDWRHSHHLRILLDELFGADRFVNHLIWSYGLGGSSPRGFSRKHDDILFYARGERHWFDPPRVPATSVRLAGRTKRATDVIDIPAINNMARERTGYPTQKPLALLRLLVGACAPPGGLVVDPFCGSGTTLVAARELGREAIGVDASRAAVDVARRRLADAPGAHYLSASRRPGRPA